MNNAFVACASRVVALSLIYGVVASCATVEVETKKKARFWPVTYTETITVMTEPQGARIYVEGSELRYLGKSPVTFSLSDEFDLVQPGYIIYRRHPYGNPFGEVESVEQGWYNELRAHPKAGKERHGWTVKAYLDGHRPAEKHLILWQSRAFSVVFREIKASSDFQARSHVPRDAEGSGSILLALEPIVSGRDRSYSSMYDSGPDMHEVARNADCGRRKRDFDLALGRYNEMIEKYNLADTLGVMNEANWALNQGTASGSDRGIAFLGLLSSKFTKGDAAREVEIARQEVLAARSVLCDD